MDLSKIALPSGSPERPTATPVKGDVQQLVAKKLQKRAEAAGNDQKIVPNYYEKQIDKVNVIENVAATKTIHSPEFLRMFMVKPRPGKLPDDTRTEVRTPWDFSLSCFRTFRTDNAGLLLKCFELDWSRIRLPRAVGADEIEPLKDFMRQKYKYFKDTYRYYAGVDPQQEVMCISPGTFAFLAQEMPNFIDMRTLKLAEVDLELISTNARQEPSRMAPTN